jgi:eukaryotic-like serine/threonine-protein kinase
MANKTWWCTLSAALVCSLGLCSFGLAQNSAMFRGDPAHSGTYAGNGVPKLTGVKWKFRTGGEVVSSPAVVDGVVYVGSNDGKLYAIDAANGSLKWKFATGARVASSPAVADGVVFFGSYDGNFYALDSATGHVKWKFKNVGERRYAGTHLHGALPVGEKMPDPFDVYLSSPVVWSGVVYFGSGDGKVYALDVGSGEVKWKFQTGDVVHASPAIADGRLYVGSWDSYFYALEAATGAEVWRFKTGEDPEIHNQMGIQSSATVANGVIYFGCRDSKFYALDAVTGRQLWVFSNSGSWVITSPVVHDGKVYMATSDSALLHALDAKTGASIGSMKYHWPIFGSPAIAGSTMYLAGQDGKLVAIDLAAWKQVWEFQTDASRENLAGLSKPDGSPDYGKVARGNFYDDLITATDKLHTVGTILSSPVVSGSVVYFGSADGNLYAVN